MATTPKGREAATLTRCADTVGVLRGRMSTPFFREEFPSTFEAMTETLDRAVASLLEEGWIQSQHEPCTRLCLEEALVNAVRHGNKNEADRTVTLSLVGEGDCCRIRVCDEGTGFRVDQVSYPELEQMGGRGICLIRHFMEQVRFDTGANCLEMSFRRKAS